MDPNSYQVIIYTEHCQGEPGVIAHRLAKLSGQPESVYVEGLLTGLVIFQRNLSYADAVKYKETLDLEGISAQIRRGPGDVRGEQSVETGENSQKIRFPAKEDIFSTETAGEQNANGASSGGWDALFPDLAVGVEKAPAAPAPKAGAGPAISSWQPALDTQESVVARVPVAKKQRTGAARVDRAIEKRPEGQERTENGDDIAKSRVFSGAVLSEAVSARDEARGPYAPTGFDPRPAHVPVLAAIFSGLAPGAGQIYNGQEDSALWYGMRFWWIRPWIASVRQAYEYGIRVRDYQEPRPNEASLGHALRYVAGWYLVVLVLAGVLGFGVSAFWQGRVQQEQIAMQVEVSDVVERAVHDIQFARMSSNTAVNKFLDEQNKSKHEFTMSAAERAQRLYVIGYSYCVGRQYNLCEATMRRVTSLGVQNRDAYRLQAWASMQIKEGGKTPMPEISEVPTLAELDLYQENDPDRDIVQPALDLMLHGQDVHNAENEEVDESSNTGDIDRVVMPDK